MGLYDRAALLHCGRSKSLSLMPISRIASGFWAEYADFSARERCTWSRLAGRTEKRHHVQHPDGTSALTKTNGGVQALNRTQSISLEGKT